MGQSSVILVLAATMTVGVLVFAALRHTGDADEELAGYQYKVLAREAATTGINLTVRKLVDDPDNWAVTPAAYEFTDESYYGAQFTVTVTAIHPDTVDVVSTGTDESGTHVIEARYAKGFTSLGVPPALRYAIISDEDLTLNGRANIMALDESSNANVHANGDLTSNGNNVHVEGYGSYGPDGSGTVNPAHAIDTVFDPNVDENGPSVNMYEYEEIDIPSLDPSEYNTIPPATLITAGDTTLTGVIDAQAWASALGYPAEVGTEAHPFLLYVNGNLSMSGGVTMLGYVQVVTYGDITISGNVTATTTPPPASNASEAEWDAWAALNLNAAGNTTIGFFANGDLTVSGNSAVVGQLFSNQTIDLNGGGGQKVNVIGGVTSANVNINVNGGMNIRYAQISTSTLLPGWTQIVPEGVRLVNWAEW